jgi:hypothetical protein
MRYWRIQKRFEIRDNYFYDIDYFKDLMFRGDYV